MPKPRYRIEPEQLSGNRTLWHVQEEQPLGDLTTWATIASFNDQTTAVGIARTYMTGKPNPKLDPNL